MGNSNLGSFCVIITFLFISTIAAIDPGLRIYFNLPIGDGHVNLYKKIEDISEWQFYLDRAHAYCWQGWWQVWDSNNILLLDTGYSEDYSNCGNVDLISQFRYVRFLGPQDSTNVSVALYFGDGGQGNNFTSGEEHLIESESDTNFPFQTLPRGLVSFGYSNWTLFPGKNYTGVPTCFKSQGVVDSLDFVQNNLPVQSVVRGCSDEIQVVELP